MAKINVRIYKGFDRENRSGLNFIYPWSLFRVKSVIDFQIYHPHEIKIANTKITKICS